MKQTNHRPQADISPSQANARLDQRFGHAALARRKQPPHEIFGHVVRYRSDIEPRVPVSA
jgi:hypothetical protein